jgi:amino acid transporter
METERREVDVVEPRIGLWDAISIIVGIIIGVGIFETPPKIFKLAPGPWEALGVWALSGLLALVGAFCFAELASTYPRSGGEYVYLTRAFGTRVGFLYAWAQLAVIRPGSIAALAYVFADHAGRLWPLGPIWQLLLAAASLILLTFINILGVTLSKQAQNLLTLAKLLGLVMIGVAGFFWARPHALTGRAEPESAWFALAMIFALWTFAGWHEAAYVAAEVKNSRRNLPLALLLGTAAVTLVYLLVNGAVVAGLGFEAARNLNAVELLLAAVFGGSAGAAYDLVVMVSALGAINGMIFTTARIYAAFGSDHRLFSPLSHWSRRWGTPVRSLSVQGVLSLAFVVVVGLFWTPVNAPSSLSPMTGRDGVLDAVAVENGFDTLVKYTAAVFWLFFLLTGIGLFVLRRKDAGLPRPFRVPAYPVLPIVFCGSCGYMFFGSIFSAPWESLIGLGILLAGLPFWFMPARRRHKEAARNLPQNATSLGQALTHPRPVAERTDSGGKKSSR